MMIFYIITCYGATSTSLFKGKKTSSKASTRKHDEANELDLSFDHLCPFVMPFNQVIFIIGKGKTKSSQFNMSQVGKGKNKSISKSIKFYSLLKDPLY